MISVACPLLDHEEEEAVKRVLASGQLAQGENVAAFEHGFAQICHVRKAVALSSGAAALHLALLAHDGYNMCMTEIGVHYLLAIYQQPQKPLFKENI